MTVSPTAQASRSSSGAMARLAPAETVILLDPILPLVGVSIGMARGCQQNDSLADGAGADGGCVEESFTETTEVEFAPLCE